MIQPINIPREQFPKSNVKSDGMITLNISCDNRTMEYIPDIEYVNRDGISLYIQLLLPCDRTNSTPLVIYVPGSAFHWQNVKSVIPSISLLISPQKGILTARPKGRYRKHCFWSAIKRYSANLLFSILLLAL